MIRLDHTHGMAHMVFWMIVGAALFFCAGMVFEMMIHDKAFKMFRDKYEGQERRQNGVH
jgi:hypothetical protein